MYSIWICTETSENRANTIERYHLTREVLPEKEDFYIPRYDLMEALIVNLSKNSDAGESESEMIRCLTDLFDAKISQEEKVRLLKNRYGVLTTVEFEEEVRNMTAYSSSLLKKGEDRLATLIKLLIAAGRQEDVDKAVSDEVARRELYREYGI